MLCLMRKKNQSIVIAHNITVTVLKIGKQSVRLGIVAPKEVAVHREEVEVAIQREDNP